MIDEKQIVYSKESLVDIVTDNTTSTLGTVDISGGQITLGPKSSVTYEYNYEAGQDNSIITDILQLDCSVAGLTQGMNTRYNKYLNIIIKVQYYLEIVEGETKTYYDGNIDTFEIYPYLSHESNNTLYNIHLQNSYIKKINITYKNDYESDSVKYTDIKLKYSMSLLEAINKYGGGSTYVPGSNSLKFYSVDDKYSIDSYGESLIMKIDIDESNWEEVVKPYIKPEETTYNVNTTYYNESGISWLFDLYNPVRKYTAKIRWTVRSKSNNNDAFSTNIYGNEQILYIKEARDLSDEEKTRLRGTVAETIYDREYNRILNSGDCWCEMKVSIEGRYCKIIGYETDTLIVRAEYIDAPNIYFEKEVKINNCSIVGFKFNFDDNDMEIHGSDIQFATIDIIPSNIKNRDSYGNMIELSCMTYAENGEPGGRAVFVNDNGSYSNSIGFRTLPAQLKIKGINNGKVLFTAITKHVYPSEFSKSWIAEVFDVEDIKIWIDGPDVITSNTDVYNYTIKNSQGLNMNIGGVTSNWSYESIDGGSIEYTTIQYGSSKPEIGLSIRANTNGKVVLKIILEIVNTGVSYTITKEVNINIDGLVETTEITTNKGLFEITQGGGQLEVYCTPNYNSGGYSFSQVSIDGGSVSINDKGNYCIITADKNGRLYLVCTPTYGQAVQVEIVISGQYPENVKLISSTDNFKVALGGQITIYAESENIPNSKYDRYTWTFDKLYPDSNVSQSAKYKYTQLTGSGLGKILLNCIRYEDSKLMNTAVVKIVQSLDSDKTVLPYPNTQQYWVVYRRTDQSNRLWLLTIDGTVTLDKLIKTTGNRLNTDNVTLGAYAQYKIESGVWTSHGSWSGDTSPAGSVGTMYASNLDIYDEEGNLLIAKTDNYDDVDFDKIIYG